VPKRIPSETEEAKRKCPNHNSTGKGKLNAIKRNCHNEKIAPTKRLKVIPKSMILSNFNLPFRNWGNKRPKRIKSGIPIKKVHSTE
jgi:hypothetical protein